jgi:hypothetical protein
LVKIVSYDEQPGIQAIANTTPDLPPEPGVQAAFARDHEYKRYGTVSLLAGINLLTGQVHALVRDRHAAANPSNFSSLSTPPIRPIQRSSSSSTINPPTFRRRPRELKDRIMAAMDEFNRHPVVHTLSYKLDKAA